MRIDAMVLFTAVFPAVCLLSFPSWAGPKLEEHTILLSTRGNGPEFGRPVALVVRYRNMATSQWTVPTPVESDGVWLLYQPSGTDVLPRRRSMATGPELTAHLPNGATVQGTGRARGRPLAVLAGEEARFVVLLEPAWTGHLAPGNWTVWLRDENAGMESNRVAISLRFTLGSVRACLERATAKDASGSQQAWHAEWLRKIMPGLDVRWGNRNTPPDKMARIRAQRAKGFEEFRAFLKDPKNADAIQAAIDRINREAGLPVEEEKPVNGGQ